jgi:hypothetical protein
MDALSGFNCRTSAGLVSGLVARLLLLAKCCAPRGAPLAKPKFARARVALLS